MKITDLLSESVITERVLNLFNDAEKAKYVDEVWNLLSNAYKDAGGFKSAASPEELVQKTGLWKLITRNGRVTALGIYRDQDGRKSIASGTDGSPQGKLDYKMLKSEDVKFNRAWAEVSGGPEKVMARLGAKPIPNKFAAALTGKEILELNPDGYHYTRLIMGEPHEKVIYGSVNLSPDTAKRIEDSGIKLHDLPSNIA